MPVAILAPVDDIDVPVADPIEDALLSALEIWSQRDVRGLRRALLAVLTALDEAP